MTSCSMLTIILFLTMRRLVFAQQSSLDKVGNNHVHGKSNQINLECNNHQWMVDISKRNGNQDNMLLAEVIKIILKIGGRGLGIDQSSKTGNMLFDGTNLSEMV